MGEIIEVYAEDIDIYGGPVLFEAMLKDRIENQGKTIKLSGTFIAEHGIPDSIKKYSIGPTLDGVTFDATFFVKRTHNV